jgi:IclR family transcriptional regulator, KDG regulon repressor
VSEQPSVKILDKALRILLLFGQRQPEWGVAALAREVGIPKTTVYRILRVLQQHGFLIQDLDSRRFRLGLGALELGRRAYEGIELRRVAQPVIEHLAAVSGETVLLQVLDPERQRVVCIERAQQRVGLRLILEVGATAPLHAGCSAKALLAFLPEEEIEAVIAKGLPAVTPHTITDPDELRRDLAEVRRRGYAVSFEETDLGVAGISVPVRDHLDRVIASLSISGPITRINQVNVDTFVELGRQGARRIAAELGHQPSAALYEGELVMPRAVDEPTPMPHNGHSRPSTRAAL